MSSTGISYRQFKRRNQANQHALAQLKMEAAHTHHTPAHGSTAAAAPFQV